eukprot:6478878-Amphidinium_carterae.1
MGKRLKLGFSSHSSRFPPLLTFSATRNTPIPKHHRRNADWNDVHWTALGVLMIPEYGAPSAGIAQRLPCRGAEAMP